MFGSRGLVKSLLLAGLLAAIACLPVRALAADAVTAHARHTASVVMMIGGMTDDADTAAASPLRMASAEISAIPDDAGRRSVVLQPGSSRLTAAIRQTSASVAARVMALSPIVDEAAHVADVDSALLMAVIDVESAGDPQAVSPKGATGLMQLMPGTGERHGASNLFDPRQNIVAGARYLRELMRQFGDLPLVLAAYNAGEGAVQKYGGQIPPYAETMGYVPKVIARYAWYRAAMSSMNRASVRELPANARGRWLVVRSATAD
ncbi:lytic transglycosylase domain-containing protein [Paraburkholderia ribeironis]|uniref:lytic transglycosylase domain-containing protein n=1 Tax=Paraburkholderia ribeironis TaxID=1247936 RepID=UPI001FE732E6|nr:lytic transglycosylase domain-containing protein [Paraburkholderia ribeironis]